MPFSPAAARNSGALHGGVSTMEVDSAIKGPVIHQSSSRGMAGQQQQQDVGWGGLMSFLANQTASERNVASCHKARRAEMA